MTLLDACRDVMNDATVTARYPKGMSAVEVLDEIRAKRGTGAQTFGVVQQVRQALRDGRITPADLGMVKVEPSGGSGLRGRSVWDVRQTWDCACGQDNNTTETCDFCTLRREDGERDR